MSKSRKYDDAFAHQLNKLGIASLEDIEYAQDVQRQSEASGKAISIADALISAGIITPAIKKNITEKIANKKRGRIKQLGQYKLDRKLGEGGMGAVFLAEDTLMQRHVAIKILPRKYASNEDFLSRFRREAKAAGQLNHPNICGAYAVGEEQGTHFYVMEYCEGESLSEKLDRENLLLCEDALRVVADTARGLKYAHELGFIHRDIKPANIFLLEDGEVKILDLGLSKDLADEDSSFVTQGGIAIGTPHYISPEQARAEKDVDGRADIYSLGATFYHLVTGMTPFDATNPAAVLMKHLTEPAPDPRDMNAEVPGGYAQAITKMMAKKPEDRYADCQELLDDLERVRTGQSIAGSPGDSERLRAAPRKKPRRRTSGAREVPGDRGRRTSSRHKAIRPRRTSGAQEAVGVRSRVGQAIEVSNARDADRRKYMAWCVGAALLVVAGLFLMTGPSSSTSKERTGRNPRKKRVASSDGDGETGASTKTASAHGLAPTLSHGSAGCSYDFNTPESYARFLRDFRQGKRGYRFKKGMMLGVQAHADNQLRIAFNPDASAEGVWSEDMSDWTHTKHTWKGDWELQLKALWLPVEVSKTAQIGLVFEREGIKVSGCIVRVFRTYLYGGLGEKMNSVLTTAHNKMHAHGPAKKYGDLKLPLDIKWVKKGGRLDCTVNGKPFYGGEIPAGLLGRMGSNPVRLGLFCSQGGLTCMIDDLRFTPLRSSPGTSSPIEPPQKPLAGKSIRKLFKGNIKSYDTRSKAIDIEWDLTNKLHWQDIDCQPRQGRTDKTGAYERPNGLSILMKRVFNAVMILPQFSGSDVSVTLSFEDFRTSPGGNFGVAACFHCPASEGKTERINVAFEKRQKSVRFCASAKSRWQSFGETFTSAPFTGSFPQSGTLEYACKGSHYQVKLNGKLLLEYSAKEGNDHRGFSIGGGWDARYTVTRIRVRGKLDKRWLREAGKRP